MSKKVSIDAQLIPCVAQFEAHPGDMLLVLEDKCLGVYRGVTKVPCQSVKAANADREVTRDLVLATLQSGPMNAKRIADYLGIPRSDATVRHRVHDKIASLVREGKIEPLPGTKRNHVYSLVQ